MIGKIKGGDLKNFKHLPHRHAGTKVVVQSIFVTHIKQNDSKFWSNRKDSPLYVSIFVKNPETGLGSGSVVSTILSSSKRTILDIEKALEIGMKNTNFSNSSGINSPNNLSTVRDILIMSKYLIKMSKSKLI